MTFEESIFLAAPAFFLLIGIEYAVARWQHKDIYSNPADAISSISSGIANGTVAALGIGVALVSYSWMLEHFALFHFDTLTPLTWVLVLLGLDFAGYWGHRFTHTWNFLWQMHVIHHSSEEFNLPCALRQTVSGQLLQVFTFLGLPLAILGVPFEIIAVVSLVHLFYQYWYHTQLIGNLGWLERIIVTPEQHAIHHAINPEYIDKNFGQWLCIWDRMFGTFQAKIPGIEPVFGVTQPVRSWNPLKIDFMIWTQMLQDIVSTRSLSQKLGVVVSRTGRRPDDAAAMHPAAKIDDVFHFDKYRPAVRAPVFTLCVFEFLLTLFLLMFFFHQISSLGRSEVLLFGGFILLSVATYTTVMEGRRATALLSLRFAAYLLLMVYWQGDWFGINRVASGLGIALAAFYAVMIAVSCYLNAPARGLPSALWQQARG
jgi:alkylglycerol monooxygenase